MFTIEEAELLGRLLRYAGWCLAGAILIGAGWLLLR
jgi:hypothetical protein